MKKLKCSSCGGEISVDDDKEYGTCPYCGTKYKLNEDINLNIKLDDNTKEVLNAGLGTAKHFSIFFIVPIVLFVFIFISMVVFGFIHSSRVDKNFEDSVKQQQEDSEKLQEQTKNEWDKHSFNSTFFGANGTNNAFFVKNTLDDIIQSNKTNDRKITLVFNGVETMDESEIINMKHSLSGDYEVSLNYDEDGYINKIVLEELN